MGLNPADWEFKILCLYSLLHQHEYAVHTWKIIIREPRPSQTTFKCASTIKFVRVDPAPRSSGYGFPDLPGII